MGAGGLEAGNMRLRADRQRCSVLALPGPHLWSTIAGQCPPPRQHAHRGLPPAHAPPNYAFTAKPAAQASLPPLPRPQVAAPKRPGRNPVLRRALPAGGGLGHPLLHQPRCLLLCGPGRGGHRVAAVSHQGVGCRLGKEGVGRALAALADAANAEEAVVVRQRLLSVPRCGSHFTSIAHARRAPFCAADG